MTNTTNKLDRYNWIESNDARYYAFIEDVQVNGSTVYVGSVYARGFEDDNSVTTKISTFYKYTPAEARRAIFQSIKGYQPAQ